MHPETPSDPPRQTMAYGDGVLAWTDEGQGAEVILAIPGLPGSVRDFRWLAPALLPDVRLVRVELPGFGHSSRQGWSGMAVPERARAVLALMDGLGLESVHLLSHSAGGMVVSHLAATAPQRVRSCSLLASPGPRPHYPLAVYRALASLFAWPLGRALMHPLQRILYKAVGFPSYLTDEERMYTTLDASANNFEAHGRAVSAITQPLLMAWARDDRLIPVDIFEALEALAPQGPKLRFDEGGHNIQKTHALEIAAAIKALIRVQ